MWTAAAWIVCIGACAGAQDTASSADSLGDLARQTRARRAATESNPSKAQDLVDDMQQEQEAAENAPVGYRNYNAGDYRLFVPYPFSLEGRENGGAVLAGSRIGLSNTEVMTGNPIPVPANLSPAELVNTVRQLASLQGAQAYCSAINQGSHKTFRCSWQTSPRLLDHEVRGSEEFILASNRLIPVMCVSPDDAHPLCVADDTHGHNTCNDRERQLHGWDHRKAQAAADARYKDEQTTVQACDQIIYPSIQLQEDIVVHPVSMAEGKNPGSANLSPTHTGPVVAGLQATSLADLARETRQAPHAKAPAILDNAEGNASAPAGFQLFVVTYCANPQQCSQATVVIPEKAEVVSQVNGQHIFRAAINGSAALLYAGPADVNAPYRSLTAPDYLRIRDLANSNGWSSEKTDGVSTQEVAIEGRPALITRFRYEREPKKWWVGERVLIQDQGQPFLLGCTAAEENFADAEVLCTTMVNSLRLR